MTNDQRDNLRKRVERITKLLDDLQSYSLDMVESLPENSEIRSEIGDLASVAEDCADRIEKKHNLITRCV
jgi:uncharacterized coiled-coil DUF342 family protein